MQHSSQSGSDRLSPIAKRYLRAVKRELCLSGSARAQALKDLEQQLRGMDYSYEDFIARCGSPLQTAEIMNRSIPGYVYSKSLLRIPCLIAGLLGTAVLLYHGFMHIALRFMMENPQIFFDDSSAASLGIIGGADGPTAIFVSRPRIQHRSRGRSGHSGSADELLRTG